MTPPPNCIGHIGKGASRKKFKTSRHFQVQATLFDIKSASPKEIFAAGETGLTNKVSPLDWG